MAIRANLTPEQLAQQFETSMNRRINAIIEMLKYVGETCITHARDNGDYIDRTGNLRSSIGYLIVRDGVILHRGGFVGSGEGKADGEKLADEISRTTTGIALIVVAGMKYAKYVEALNRDVISSSELVAEELVPSMMKQIGFK